MECSMVGARAGKAQKVEQIRVVTMRPASQNQLVVLFSFVADTTQVHSQIITAYIKRPRNDTAAQWQL